MANINISELTLAGSKLFQDSETFLDQLTDREIEDIQGGALSGLGAIPNVMFTVATNIATIPDVFRVLTLNAV